VSELATTAEIFVPWGSAAVNGLRFIDAMDSSRASATRPSVQRPQTPTDGTLAGTAAAEAAAAARAPSRAGGSKLAATRGSGLDVVGAGAAIKTVDGPG